MLDISCQLHILRYLVFCCLEEKTGWLWHWTWLDLNVSYEKNSRNLLDVSHDSSMIAELGFVTLTRESGYKPFFKQKYLGKNRLSSINPLLVSLQRFCICLFFVWCGPWLGIEPRTSRMRSQHCTTNMEWFMRKRKEYKMISTKGTYFHLNTTQYILQRGWHLFGSVCFLKNF